MFVFVCVRPTGASSSRKMAEVGEIQRLPEWKPAQRIPVRGNELVTVQLVQQVNIPNASLNGDLVRNQCLW